MTYADTGQSVVFNFYERGDLSTRLRASGGNTGAVEFLMIGEGVVSAFGNQYTPGIDVPFNIASRYTTDLINGAVDGTALTADTDPTALPDLSAIDFNLALQYMGTLRQFRMWDEDLGDSGIEEASE